MDARRFTAGSLGNTGKPLAEESVQKGHEVTVITGKTDKQKDIAALNARAAVGSLADADFLAETFRGADAAYCMIQPNFAENDYPAYYRRIAGNYAAAVQKSGVSRVIYLSSFGAHQDKGTGIIIGAHDAEQILNRLSNVAVTHLRPAYFYYNLLSADLTEMYAAPHTGAMAEDYYRNKTAALGKVKLEDYAKEFAAVFQNS